jgi:hypothetical protein
MSVAARAAVPGTTVAAHIAAAVNPSEIRRRVDETLLLSMSQVDASVDAGTVGLVLRHGSRFSYLAVLFAPRGRVDQESFVAASTLCSSALSVVSSSGVSPRACGLFIARPGGRAGPRQGLGEAASDHVVGAYRRPARTVLLDISHRHTIRFLTHHKVPYS